MTTRQPKGTIGIIIANIVVFLLELRWGGSQSAATLREMGANLGRKSFEEPWRLITTNFLHAGGLHLAVNMWALVVFGTVVERALGTPQFLVLYGIAGCAGALASAIAHHEVMSVGASGAIWGLMCAQLGVLVSMQRKGGGERVSLSISIAVQVLLFNLIYSLRGDTDLAAHFGGGVAGIAAVIVGFTKPGRPESRGWWCAAWVTVVLIVGSIAVAVGRGHPWSPSWNQL